MLKLFDKKDVFTILNAEEARVYEDRVGYFGDSLDELQNAVEENDYDVLIRVITTKDVVRPFMHVPGPCDCLRPHALFLPVEKVNREEDHYRPLTLNEFNEIFKLGQIITFRSEDFFGKRMYTGYTCGKNSNCKVDLSGHLYDLDELFENFEYQNTNGDWCRFGMWIGRK